MRLLPACAALLALSGCLQAAAPADPFPAQHEAKSVEQPDFPGLVASGTLSGGGAQVALDAQAVNNGPRTYKVSAVCVQPWGDTLAGPLGEVHRTQPQVTCLAFGLKAFPPGQSLPFHAAWNGSLWDSQAERFVPAPAGAYTWEAQFSVYAGGSGTEYETHDWLKLPFTVRVA
jgi:hypothetical protein